MTASAFLEALGRLRSDTEPDKVARYFRDNDGRTLHFGVRFGDVFATAEQFAAMPPAEIEQLLDSDYYEVRMGAAAIMDFQARQKKLPEAGRKALFDLYLRRHDRLNNWDLVDRAAYNVIGRYLEDKPRDILDRLAQSEIVWERRTAIVSTYHFIKKGELDDTFRIAELLLRDPHDLIHKAVGGWIREAGKKDPARLLGFLDAHAAAMPRVMLRYAVEKLAPELRQHYLGS